MEIDDQFCPMSPTNPLLDKLSVDFSEDDDNQTVIDFELSEDNQPIVELNQIQQMINKDIDDRPVDQKNGNDCEDNDNEDTDVEEIIPNCGSDDFLMGSQLMAEKVLKKRENSVANSGHKECENRREKEMKLRLEMEMELELERQQRIEFQRQLEQYMGYSLRKQFDDCKQIKSLKFELLKCRQELQTLKKSVNKCQSNGSEESKSKSEEQNSNPELNCSDCKSIMKSEVSMILHLINHCIEEEEFRLETKVFRLDELTDSTLDAIRKSVSYCCPRCALTFNCLDIYYHIYKCHSSERPIFCSQCQSYCTHLDYYIDHNQRAHNGVGQKVSYVDISPRNPGSQPNRFQAFPKSYSNGISSLLSNTYRPYSLSRPNVSNTRNVLRSTRNSGKASTYESNSRSMSDDGSESPEVIQLSDSPPPSNKPSVPTASAPKRTLSAEFKCDFPDCDFKTTSKDKLDFHTSAHTNSKFKCPYCPYVGNILNDIYRHIQKSKKHDGLKVYECRECSYGTNCLSSFKEHLHKKHFDTDSSDEEEINEYITDMFRNEHSANGEKSDSS